MAEIHVYVAFQNLNLNTTQRGRVWNAVQAFYEAVQIPTNRPDEIFWPMRRSNDGQIAIGEALFDTDRLSVATFKQFLATEFNRDPAQIADARSDITISARPSPFWTFAFNSTNYFRVGVFGGLNATREQSQAEALAYLAQNQENWNAPI